MKEDPKSSAGPLVTVGIPTFNRSASLEQTLQSVIGQDYPDIEIIVSDNASTDPTEKIGTLLQQQHSNIVYIRQISNIGATENFNFVLRQAKGQYFMWLSDDDWIDKNYISECVRAFAERPAAEIIGGQPKYYYGDIYLYTGFAMNIDNDSPAERVINYFASVQHNGIFYGLMRTGSVQKQALKEVMGGDLLTVAGMVFTGKAYTLETCHLHRRRGGASLNGKTLAKSMNLPWFFQYFPRLSIAYNVFHYIAHDNTFSSMSSYQRYLLGMQCVLAAFYRKVQSILFKQRFVERAGIPDIQNK